MLAYRNQIRYTLWRLSWTRAPRLHTKYVRCPLLTSACFVILQHGIRWLGCPLVQDACDCRTSRAPGVFLLVPYGSIWTQQGSDRLRGTSASLCVRLLLKFFKFVLFLAPIIPNQLYLKAVLKQPQLFMYFAQLLYVGLIFSMAALVDLNTFPRCFQFQDIDNQKICGFVNANQMSFFSIMIFPARRFPISTRQGPVLKTHT